MSVMRDEIQLQELSTSDSSDLLYESLITTSIPSETDQSVVEITSRPGSDTESELESVEPPLNEETTEIQENSTGQASVDDNPPTEPGDPLGSVSQDPVSQEDSDFWWFPWSLSKTYITILGSLSFAFGISCLVLTLLSQRHQGLRDASDSAAFQFSWRFLPTIIAVIYTLLWTPTTVDILRTEPWALLLLPDSNLLRAEDTILRAMKIWPIELINVFRYKETRGIRWVVVLAIICGTVGPILLSPLSAGLFDLLEIVKTDSNVFSTIDPSIKHFPAIDITDSMYLKAVTNFIQDVPTSVWIQQDFVIRPFWPSSSIHDLYNPSYQSETPLVWSGNTDVYNIQMQCTEGTNFTVKEVKEVSTLAPIPYSVLLLHVITSDDGCSYVWKTPGYWIICSPNNHLNGTELEAKRCVKDHALSNLGSLTWSKTSSEGWQSAANMLSNSTEITEPTRRCIYDDLIAIYKSAPDQAGSTEILPESHYRAYTCSTTYQTANVPVNITFSPSTPPSASIDTKAFTQSKQKVDSTFLAGMDFQDMFLKRIGSKNLVPFSLPYYRDSFPDMNGSILPLAAYYNLNVSAMLNAPDIIQQARKMKQAFFGQVLQSAYDELIRDKHNITTATVAIISRRVRLVITFWVGIVISAILVCTGALSTRLTQLVGQRRRPLDLKHDPITPLSATIVLLRKYPKLQHYGSFTAANDNIWKRDPCTSQPGPPIGSKFVDSQHWVRKLRSLFPKSGASWLSFYLGRWTGLIMLFLLASITLSIGLIFRKSQEPAGNRQPFWLNEHNITLGTHVASITPLSIIPATIAIIIKLWWGLIDDTFRRLSPYIAMAQTPRRITDGAALAYINTPLVLITSEAVKNRQLLLALVTFGALLTEVLQITMSARWVKSLKDVNRIVKLNRGFEIRIVPHIYPQIFSENRDIKSLYRTIEQGLQKQNLFSNWLMHGFVRAAYNSSPPSWTRDDWVIPPLDLPNHIQEELALIGDNMRSSSTNQPKTFSAGSAPSLTFESPMLSGQTKCSIIQTEITDQWMVKHDGLDDPARWIPASNLSLGLTTGYELLDKIRMRYNDPMEEYSTREDNFIGQWLPFGFQERIMNYDATLSKNFTVVWIHAGPYQTYNATNDIHLTSDSDFAWGPVRHWIFRDKPQIRALNCEPIFVKANARVTIILESKQIQHYELIDVPKAISEPWNDPFIMHFANESSYADEFLDVDHSYIGAKNVTISWGYLFQLELFSGLISDGGFWFGTPWGGADTVPTDGGIGQSRQIREADLFVDLMSYGALALARYDRLSLLDGDKLAAFTQRVFSKFFQSFALIPHPDLGYLAYQPINATIPFGLDFAPQTTMKVEGNPYVSWSPGVSCHVTFLTSRGSFSNVPYVDCSLQLDASGKSITLDKAVSSIEAVTYPWKPEYTLRVTGSTIETRIMDGGWSTRSFSPTKIIVSESLTSTMMGPVLESFGPQTTIYSSPGKTRQRVAYPSYLWTTTGRFKQVTTPTALGSVQATLSVRRQVLIMSPIVTYLSIGILTFLCIIIGVVFLLKHHHLRQLPRDVDTPANILGYVAESKTLQAWVAEQERLGILQEKLQSESIWPWEKKPQASGDDKDILVGIGYFLSSDGKQKWGVEVDASKEPLASP